MDFFSMDVRRENQEGVRAILASASVRASDAWRLAL
jgi:hypothetical protein